MRKFLVSFTHSDGLAHTIQVEAVTAMLAVRNAHARVSETVTLVDIVAIACTEQTE
jgi:hypothetical protein